MTENSTITAPDAPSASPLPAAAPQPPEIISEHVYQHLPEDRRAQLVKQGDGWIDPADKPAAPAVTRPGWVPESAWHRERGFDADAFDRYYREEVAPILQAEEVRKAALPQTPDDYQVAVSPAFRLPPGDQVALDANDPMWGEAKAWAHKHGLSKDGFQQAVDLVVARDSITQAQVTRARNAELAKLGPAAQARVSAVEAAFVDIFGETDAKAEMARIWTAADVIRAEKAVAKFRQSGRASSQPPGVSDAQWASMSPGERWEYSRSHDQKQFTGSR